MTDDRIAAELAAIRQREHQATPGPWGWRGNIDNGDPYLTSLGHRDEAKPDGTVIRHRAGDVLGHIPVELTRADAILLGIGNPDNLPEPKVSPDPPGTYDERYDAAIEAAREAEIEDYLNDDYGQPRTKDRLAFCTDWLYTDARKLVTFQVAPDATDRADPRVYRADITGIRHPDAEFIEHSRQDLSRLLAAVDETLKLHGSVPWYASAMDCEHPEPAEDSDAHDDWYDDHTSGTGGIVVCLLTQVDSLCPECTRLKYDTLEPEGDDFVSAPCGTRTTILKALDAATAAGSSR
jgi:hypothetical protein